MIQSALGPLMCGPTRSVWQRGGQGRLSQTVREMLSERPSGGCRAGVCVEVAVCQLLLGSSEQAEEALGLAPGSTCEADPAVCDYVRVSRCQGSCKRPCILPQLPQQVVTQCDMMWAGARRDTESPRRLCCCAHPTLADTVKLPEGDLQQAGDCSLSLHAYPMFGMALCLRCRGPARRAGTSCRASAPSRSSGWGTSRCPPSGTRRRRAPPSVPGLPAGRWSSSSR